MFRKTCFSALTLLAFSGCGTEEKPADNVASPSEGAKVINTNPTVQPVDVPNTPKDEAAAAKQKEEAAKPEGAAAPTKPADETAPSKPADEAAPAKPEGDATPPKA